ncbi:hypothetical protein NDA01_20025 [Trichocoleus desertorum AS-A10]|uniref:hypothetical protein n=1 Tax=Trichocoleus desertorum TaxID=1481672 RepID=UPI0032989BD1
MISSVITHFGLDLNVRKCVISTFAEKQNIVKFGDSILAFNLQSLYDEANRDANNVCDSEIEFISRKSLPQSDDAFLEAPKWFRIENVACSFIDMVGSSMIDYQAHPVTSCKIYQAFTGNLVHVWRAFGVGFFDLKGDGGFALFDGENAVVKAFLAAEVFRSWVDLYLDAKIQKITKSNVSIKTRSSVHIGTVDVKRIGKRGTQNQNHVWLNSTINQSSKLLNIASREEDELIASEAAYKVLKECEFINLSCDCDIWNGRKNRLWKFHEHEDLHKYGLRGGWHLKSMWCQQHGNTYMENIFDEYGIKLA